MKELTNNGIGTDPILISDEETISDSRVSIVKRQLALHTLFI